MSNHNRNTNHEHCNISESGDRNKTEITDEVICCYNNIEQIQAEMHQLQQKGEEQRKTRAFTARENFLVHKMNGYMRAYKCLKIEQLKCDLHELQTHWDKELEDRRHMCSDPRRKHSFGQFEVVKKS